MKRNTGGCRIELRPEQLTVRGGDASGVARLLSGRGCTTNSNHMWTSPLGTSKTGRLELVITLPHDQLPSPPATLKVWNYNRSVQYLGMGVCWMVIYQGARVLKHVKLHKGCGNASIDYSQSIQLTSSADEVKSTLPLQPIGSNNIAPAAVTSQQPEPENTACTVQEHVGNARPSIPPLIPSPSLMSDAQLLAELKRRGLSPRIHDTAVTADKSTAQVQTSSQIPLLAPQSTHRNVDVVVSEVSIPKPVSSFKSSSDMASAGNAKAAVPHSTTAQLQPRPVPCASEQHMIRPSQTPSYHNESLMAAAAQCIADRSNSNARAQSPQLAPERHTRLASSRFVSATTPTPSNNTTRGITTAEKPLLLQPPLEARRQIRSPEHADLLEVRRNTERSAGNSGEAEPLVVIPPRRQSARNACLDISDGSTMHETAAPVHTSRRAPLPSGAKRTLRKRVPIDLDTAVLASDPAECTASVNSLASGSSGGAVPRRIPAVNLQQSLDSLSFFQRHHRGRLRDCPVPAPVDQPTNRQPPDALDLNMGTRTPSSSRHMSAQLDDSAPSITDSKLTGASSTSSSAEAPRPYCPPPAFLSRMNTDDETPIDTKPASTVEASACTPFPDPAFCIPVTPRGRVLTLQLHTTWGDKDYIGLSSIEIFDSEGASVIVEDPMKQVTASPHSVNDLAECSCDPRTPDKLVDGVHLTCSDLHQWLAPFAAGEAHTVTIDLGRPTTLGMVRVWNYNKSRIHAQRGVRAATFLLDGVCIFQVRGC